MGSYLSQYTSEGGKRRKSSSNAAVAVGITVALLLLILALVAIFGGLGGKPDGQGSTNDGNRRPAPPPAPKEAYYPSDGSYLPVTATVLAAAYATNPDRADGNYMGRELKVTGTVQIIGKDPSGQQYVQLAGDKSLDVRCKFDSDAAQQLGSLSVGIQASVLGICQGKGIQDVYLSQCSVLPN